MFPIKRPFAAAGAAALLGLTLTACGSSYPSDASTDDFCKALGDVVTATTAVEDEEPGKEEWEDIQASYEDLGETGTPKGISDGARKGFEVVVDTITDLDYDDAKKEFGDKGGDDNLPGVSKEDDKNADKFFEYAQEECADALGG